MSAIALIFLLIALCMVLSAFFPGWAFNAGPVVTPNRLIGLVIGLVVLYICYLIVLSLFGAGPVLAH